MMRHVLVIAAFALLVAPPARGQDSFTPGHIFVSVSESEPCDGGLQGREWIIEIDPETGATSVFADSDDGICIVGGLRFTPDGSRLLLLNAGHFFPVDGGWVQAFKPDGTSEVILTREDGLLGPYGANGLDFDGNGNLFVVNDLNASILRFDGMKGPGEVFADFNDGVTGRGGLAFGPGGDLFYGSMDGNVILRLAPDGDPSDYDFLPQPSSLVFDRVGNLFVAAGYVYRYDEGNVGRRRILAGGFEFISGLPQPISISPDGSTVYFLEAGGLVYLIDTESGDTRVLANASMFSDNPGVGPGGIAVFAPPPPVPIPTVNHWGVISLALSIPVIFRLMNTWRAER